MKPLVELINEETIRVKAPTLVVRKIFEGQTKTFRWGFQPLKAPTLALPVFTALRASKAQKPADYYQVAVIDKGEYSPYLFHPDLINAITESLKGHQLRVYRTNIVRKGKLATIRHQGFFTERIDLTKAKLLITPPNQPPITFDPRKETDKEIFLKLFRYAPDQIPKVGFQPIKAEVVENEG